MHGHLHSPPPLGASPDTGRRDLSQLDGPLPASAAAPADDATPRAQLALLLDRTEAARFLGFTVSTFDKYRAERTVPDPAFQAARKVLWSADELRAWCTFGCPAAASWNVVWANARRRKVN